MKIRAGTFNYLEDELMHYHDTMREIERMRLDILHQGSTSDGGGRGSAISDPTSRIAIELTSNLKLDRMERITNIIHAVVNRLQPEKRKLIQIMYWDRPRILTWQGAAIKLHITKRTAFRWRKEILKAIAERGGYI